MNKYKSPRILLLDIETSPLISYTWGLFDQNLGLNQIVQDWNVLSWSAKWAGEDKIFYEDLSKSKNVHDDRRLLQGIWKLLNEADIVVGQNSNRFDLKKLNARFVIHGMKPPSSFKKVDTLLIARKVFGFTSNKLEYLAEKLCVKYKKLTKRKFNGMDLWRECLAGNQEAWKEMKLYNIRDVNVLEEVYERIKSWDNSHPDINLYHSGTENVCKCGSTDYKRNGFAYTSTGKFQRFTCRKCGSETRDRKNLLDPDKKEFLKVNVK